MSKENLYFDDKVNKLFSTVFITVFSKRNRKHILCVSTYGSVGELEKAVETLASVLARVPTAFLTLPNFHLYFIYNLTETGYMFSVS